MQNKQDCKNLTMEQLAEEAGKKNLLFQNGGWYCSPKNIEIEENSKIFEVDHDVWRYLKIQWLY